MMQNEIYKGSETIQILEVSETMSNLIGVCNYVKFNTFKYYLSNQQKL